MFLLSNPVFIQTVANISTILFTVVIVIQLLLALGILPVSMAFNTLGNIASSSKMEKLIFTPVTVLLTLTCLIVSASNPVIDSTVKTLLFWSFD
jgi:hypothetical protein